MQNPSESANLASSFSVSETLLITSRQGKSWINTLWEGRNSGARWQKILDPAASKKNPSANQSGCGLLRGTECKRAEQDAKSVKIWNPMKCFKLRIRCNKRNKPLRSLRPKYSRKNQCQRCGSDIQSSPKVDHNPHPLDPKFSSCYCLVCNVCSFVGDPFILSYFVIVVAALQWSEQLRSTKLSAQKNPDQEVIFSGSRLT